jgi:hypothetical protein
VTPSCSCGTGSSPTPLRLYKPAKLRDIMAPHFEALVDDGYLSGFRFGAMGRKEGRGGAAVKVAFANWHPVAAPNPRLTLYEMATINLGPCSRLLGCRAKNHLETFREVSALASSVHPRLMPNF